MAGIKPAAATKYTDKNIRVPDKKYDNKYNNIDDKNIWVSDKFYDNNHDKIGDKNKEGPDNMYDTNIMFKSELCLTRFVSGHILLHTFSNLSDTFAAHFVCRRVSTGRFLESIGEPSTRM